MAKKKEMVTIVQNLWAMTNFMGKQKGLLHQHYFTVNY